MKSSKIRNVQRKRRHRRIRISGTEKTPRLVITKSLKNIYAQVVDDSVGRIILSLSTLSKEIKVKNEAKTKTEIAHIIGILLAEKCKNSKIESVVFDRAGYKYHGRVKALADGARKGGLRF